MDPTNSPTAPEHQPPHAHTHFQKHQPPPTSNPLRFAYDWINSKLTPDSTLEPVTNYKDSIRELAITYMSERISKLPHNTQGINPESTDLASAIEQEWAFSAVLLKQLCDMPPLKYLLSVEKIQDALEAGKGSIEDGKLAQKLFEDLNNEILKKIKNKSLQLTPEQHAEVQNCLDTLRMQMPYYVQSHAPRAIHNLDGVDHFYAIRRGIVNSILKDLNTNKVYAAQIKSEKINSFQLRMQVESQLVQQTAAMVRNVKAATSLASPTLRASPLAATDRAQLQILGMMKSLISQGEGASPNALAQLYANKQQLLPQILASLGELAIQSQSADSPDAEKQAVELVQTAYKRRPEEPPKPAIANQPTDKEKEALSLFNMKQNSRTQLLTQIGDLAARAIQLKSLGLNGLGNEAAAQVTLQQLTNLLMLTKQVEQATSLVQAKTYKQLIDESSALHGDFNAAFKQLPNQSIADYQLTQIDSFLEPYKVLLKEITADEHKAINEELRTALLWVIVAKPPKNSNKRERVPPLTALKRCPVLLQIVAKHQQALSQTPNPNEATKKLLQAFEAVNKSNAVPKLQQMTRQFRQQTPITAKSKEQIIQLSQLSTLATNPPASPDQYKQWVNQLCKLQQIAPTQFDVTMSSKKEKALAEINQQIADLTPVATRLLLHHNREGFQLIQKRIEQAIELAKQAYEAVDDEVLEGLDYQTLIGSSELLVSILQQYPSLSLSQARDVFLKNARSQLEAISGNDPLKEVAMTATQTLKKASEQLKNKGTIAKAMKSCDTFIQKQQKALAKSVDLNKNLRRSTQNLINLVASASELIKGASQDKASRVLSTAKGYGDKDAEKIFSSLMLNKALDEHRRSRDLAPAIHYEQTKKEQDEILLLAQIAATELRGAIPNDSPIKQRSEILFANLRAAKREKEFLSIASELIELTRKAARAHMDEVDGKYNKRLKENPSQWQKIREEWLQDRLVNYVTPVSIKEPSALAVFEQSIMAMKGVRRLPTVTESEQVEFQKQVGAFQLEHRVGTEFSALKERLDQLVGNLRAQDNLDSDYDRQSKLIVDKWKKYSQKQTEATLNEWGVVRADFEADIDRIQQMVNGELVTRTKVSEQHQGHLNNLSDAYSGYQMSDEMRFCVHLSFNRWRDVFKPMRIKSEIEMHAWVAKIKTEEALLTAIKSNPTISAQKMLGDAYDKLTSSDLPKIRHQLSTEQNEALSSILRQLAPGPHDPTESIKKLSELIPTLPPQVSVDSSLKEFLDTLLFLYPMNRDQFYEIAPSLLENSRVERSAKYARELRSSSTDHLAIEVCDLFCQAHPALPQTPHLKGLVAYMDRLNPGRANSLESMRTDTLRIDGYRRLFETYKEGLQDLSKQSDDGFLGYRVGRFSRAYYHINQVFQKRSIVGYNGAQVSEVDTQLRIILEEMAGGKLKVPPNLLQVGWMDAMKQTPFHREVRASAKAKLSRAKTKIRAVNALKGHPNLAKKAEARAKAADEMRAAHRKEMEALEQRERDKLEFRREVHRSLQDLVTLAYRDGTLKKHFGSQGFFGLNDAGLDSDKNMSIRRILQTESSVPFTERELIDNYFAISEAISEAYEGKSEKIPAAVTTALDELRLPLAILRRQLS